MLNLSNYHIRNYFEKLQDINRSSKQIQSIKPTAKSHIKVLPLDLLKHSFSFLSLQDMDTISLVSKFFQLSVLPSNAIADFAPLIEKKKLYWKELGEYASLSSFFDKIIKTKFHGNDATIVENNPELAKEDFVGFNMPHPKIRYGEFQFTICNSIDVKIERRGEPTYRFLKGETGKILCSLAAENEHLFTMRRDAKIIQWNYLSGQIIKQINTSLTGMTSQDNFLNEFSISNEMLAVKYNGSGTKADYISSETTTILDYDGIDIPASLYDFVQKDQLFFAGGNLITRLEFKENGDIYRLLTPLKYDLWKMAVSKEYICFAERGTQKIHVQKHGMSFPRKSYNFEYVNVLHLIDNLLYGFNTKENKMYILNLNSGDIVSKINDVFNNSDINLTALETIVNITRKKRTYKVDLPICSIL